MSALAEMYVQGVSTRKVKAVTEELCGHTFSASTVSRINKSLDGLLRRFAQRRLDEAYPYLILDARYEKVRLDGVIQSQAVFIAIGINGEGWRQILGVELSNRESRSSWTTFVTSLKTRGLHGVEFVVSDDHAGLKRAVRELLPEAVWQRCYVHFLRNALDYLPRKADDDCRQELRWLYDRRTLKEAEQDLQAWLMRWATRYPKLTDWVEAHIGETLNFYSLPRQHHKHLKSTNMLERLNEEIKRRTRVVRILSQRGELPTFGPSPLCRNPRGLARGSSLPEYGVSERTEERTADRRLADHTLSHESEIAQLDVHNPPADRPGGSAEGCAVGVGGFRDPAHLVRRASHPHDSPRLGVLAPSRALPRPWRRPAPRARRPLALLLQCHPAAQGVAVRSRDPDASAASRLGERANELERHRHGAGRSLRMPCGGRTRSRCCPAHAN